MAKKNSILNIGIAALAAVCVATLMKKKRMKVNVASSENTKKDNQDPETKDFADVDDECV